MNKKEINEIKRRESKREVENFLNKLKYALGSNKVKITFQEKRKTDKTKSIQFTNKYTISDLFPDEDIVEVLKRELSTLKIEEYLETVKDKVYPQRSDMRVFVRKYTNKYVYIKIRLELLSAMSGYYDDYLFIMSFHYSDKILKNNDFPYRGRAREK